MYFYHEGYHEAYHADAALDDLRPRERRDDDRTFEPIRTSAITNWLVAMSVALCAIAAVIDLLS